MMNDANAVVIGAGAFGLSTGLYLAKRGMKDVVVVDQFEPASQTSPRAAGLFKLIQPDEARTRIKQMSVRNVLSFEQEMGVPLPVVRSGSIMLARTPEHATLIETEVRQSRGWGVELELLDPQEAHRVAPYLESCDILAAAHTPDDVYIEEPAALLHAYMAAAARLGVRILGRTPVSGIRLKNGAVEGVITSQGEIKTPLVVDAAGAWARMVGAMAQGRVPVAPVRHQLSITEPVGGVQPEEPILRIIDSAVYVRPARGGLMLGGFEADPLPVDPAQPGFDMDSIPLDMSVLDRLTELVVRQVPGLREAGIAEHRGGAFTMTPDGCFLAGPIPGAEGLWSATGCNGSGFSASPGIGQVLAEWIVDGKPSIDMGPLDPRRYADASFSEEQLTRDGIWQYSHYYDPHGAADSSGG